MNPFEVFIRAVIIYFVLLLMARLNGAKQIAQMSFYDYISGITVGSLAASISIDNSVSFLSGLCAIIFYLGFSLLINIATQKNLKISTLFTGSPLILIHHGQLQWENLKKAKMTLGELLSSLRYEGYFNINEVYEAVLETSGNVSVLPKGYAREVKNCDLELKSADPVLVTEVIMDGKILDDNLKTLGKSMDWLINELNTKAHAAPKDIGLAILDEKGILTIYKKN